MSHQSLLNVLRNCCFIAFLFYSIHNEFYAHGAVTLIRHLREGSDEMSHIDGEDNEGSKETESGFDLNENEMKKFHIWPLGVIPYYIDDYSFDKVLRDTIRAFLEHASRVTELRFLELLRPPENNSRWVFFINRQGLLGCADIQFDSFTNDGVQKVVLGYDCIKSDYGLAEIILSLVGVPPQHNAPNRDEFIKINKDNIIPDKLHLFNRLKDDEWLFHDIEYDFKSAGHYDSHKYTMNGAATIVPKDKTLYMEIGYGKCFTYKDIQKMKMLYSYIISKHRANVQLPECLKMFSPGPKFKKIRPKQSDSKPPRKKPSKYLGIKSSEEAEKSQEISTPKDMGDKNKGGQKENKKRKKPQEKTIENVDQQQTYETEKSIESIDDIKKTEPTFNSEEKTEENFENVTNKGDNKSQTLKSRFNKNRMKNINLLDLSDYTTGERY